MFMKNYIVILPTVRHQQGLSTLEQYINMAACPVTGHLVVNSDFDSKYTVKINADRSGVVDTLYKFTKDLNPGPDDVIIVASDDFYPTQNWDLFLDEHFENFDGLFISFDGINPHNSATIPILSSGFFYKLNKAIYHPAYYHAFSDTELFENAKAMGCLKDIRPQDKGVRFKHLHFSVGTRPADVFDQKMNSMYGTDNATFNRRMAMPITQRLIVP